MNLRVLVVDDSIVFRRAIAEALATLPGVEVVGSVQNGKLALQRIRELKPDVLTLDLEMPEMDGLAVLTAIKRDNHPIKVLVVSSLTQRGGQMTMRALELGAFDFITKPDASDAGKARETIQRELGQRMRVLSQQMEIRQILRGNLGAPSATANTIRPPRPPVVSVLPPGEASKPRPPGRCEMLLIGASTGGPQALARLLPQFPPDLGVPVLVVQHMPPLFTASMAASLKERCALGVREASDGETLLPNVIYIAPGGRQMRLARSPQKEKIIRITDDPPENNCRPSVDYLFRSVALHFGGQAAAAILTGMGSDGTLGLRLLRRNGCLALAQDEASSVVFGMAKAAVEAGVVDSVLPLEEIAPRLTAIVVGSRR